MGNENKCKWCDEPVELGANCISKFNNITTQIELFHEPCHSDMVRDAIEEQETKWGEEREIIK